MTEVLFYRNHSIDLLCKSRNLFLFERDHIKTKNSKEMEALRYSKKRKKHKRRAIKSFDDRFDDTVRNSNVNSIIDFNLNCSNSIKSLARNEIKITTRFMSGKLLMIAKVCFIYDVIDAFVFLTTLLQICTSKTEL